ncbi:20679_t:CDS:2 [Funneliformis geosporum]|nr:20679_t:CDS:2 [Funneliformis geosporum]
MEFPSHKKIGMDKFKKDLWNSAKNVAKIIQQHSICRVDVWRHNARPVAQIALFKDRLVTQAGWITVAGGKIGGVLGGLGFILPGFVLLMIFSYIYVLVGFNNQYFNASFRCLQPIVSAMGIPSLSSLGLGVDPTPSPGHIFALGLIAGTLSFGADCHSDYSSRSSNSWSLDDPKNVFGCVNHWQHPFYTTLTLAVFVPCFLMENAILEKIVRNKFCATFFDGITGSLIAVTPIDLLKSSVTTSTVLINLPDIDKPIAAQHNSIAAVVYMITLAALYSFKTPYLALMLVIFGAIAGSF